MKQKITHYSLLVCLMLGMSFNLVYGLLYAVRPDQKPYFIFITVLFISLVIIALGASRRGLMVGIAVLLVGGGLIGTYLYREGALFTVYWRIVFFVQRNKALISMSLCISLLTYIFTFKNFKWLVPAGIGGGLYSLYIIKNYPLPFLAVESFIFLSLCYYFYHYYKKMSRGALAYIKSIGLVMSIVLGLTYISAYIVPIKFNFLHRIFDQKSYESRAYKYGEYYPYTGRLGGDLTLDDKELLEISAPNRTYLRAGTKSIYTGHAWTNPDSEPGSFFAGSHTFEDTTEAVLGSKLLSNAPFEELFEGSAYRIIFKDLRTRSLFIPLKMNNLAVSRNSYSIYYENEDTLFLDQPYGSGFIYVIQAYTPRYESKAFEEAMKKSKKGLYSEAKKRGKDPFEGEIDSFIERANHIEEQYTHLPKSVTKRVEEFAQTITKDFTTPYEKVRAIEAYLAGNYTYTLTPGDASRTEDFVDQFLFETQEGYCTYFASAMAVLTRCIGIPSRYVEGYTMPSQMSGDSNTYTVTSKEAHAWVEVYFEGMGWVMFEPTASYQSDLRGYSSTKDDAYYTKQVEEASYTPVIQEKVGQIKDTEHMQDIGVLVLNGFVILIIGIGVGLYVRRYYYISKMPPKLSICYFYGRGLKMLMHKKHPIEPGEMESDYAKRIDKMIRFEPITMEEATKIYLRAQYSKDEMKEEEAIIIRRFYKQCKRNLKYRKM